MDSDSLARAREIYRRDVSRFAAVAGVDVHVLDEGPRDAALTVVLLSAQWLGASHGDRWAAVLTPAYRVLRIDLPGQGLTAPFPDGDYAPAAYARLIAAALEAFGVGAHVVVGTSFSGIATTLYAATQPPGLCGLILATASGLPRAPGGPAPGALPDDPALAAQDGRFPRAFYDWKLGTLLHRPMAADERARLVDEMAMLNELPGRAEEARRRVAQHDPAALSAALPGVTVPLLVQWSSGSTYLPPEMAHRIAALAPTVAGLHIYPDTGHLLITDAPEDTAHDLALFLTNLRSPS